MLPEPTSNTDTRDVYKVAQWKLTVDVGSPWWRKAYHRFIFIPLLDFSFGWMGVPTPKEVIVESDERGQIKRIYRWYEDEGIFEHPDQAEAGCLAEHWGYVRLPLGRLMPPDSAQYAGTIFPRKKNWHKWAKPTLSLVIKDRAEEERTQRTLKEYLAELNQVLDR